MKPPLLNRWFAPFLLLALLADSAQAQSSAATANSFPAAPQPPSTAQPASPEGSTAAPSQQHLAPLALKSTPSGADPAATLPATQPPSPLTLHLIVGRSFFLNS